MSVSLWNFEPSVIIGSGLLIAGYMLTVGPLRKRFQWGEPALLIQQLAFYLGCICMFLALVGPLDVLGDDALFSAHMAQHMILSFVVPPLWVIGTPGWLIQRLLPRRILASIVNPFAAFLLFNGVMWFWHLPTTYDLALSNSPAHIIEHLMFMAGGVIGWLPVLKSELAPAMTLPLKLVYLIPSMFSCTALAALITLSPTQLYTFYGHASLKWGLTPLGDQQLGGLAMWLPGDMFYVFLILWTFKAMFEQTGIEKQPVKL